MFSCPGRYGPAAGETSAGWRISRIYVPAASAISTLERRPVFCRMCETWVCTVRARRTAGCRSPGWSARRAPAGDPGLGRGQAGPAEVGVPVRLPGAPAQAQARCGPGAVPVGTAPGAGIRPGRSRPCGAIPVPGGGRGAGEFLAANASAVRRRPASRRPRPRSRRDRRRACRGPGKPRPAGTASSRRRRPSRLAGGPSRSARPGHIGSQSRPLAGMGPGCGPQRPGQVPAARLAPSASSTASSAQPGRSCPNCNGRPRCRKESSRARAGPVAPRCASM